MNDWFYEGLYSAFYRQYLKKDKILITKKTQFQDLEIFENSFFGKVLTLDAIVQTTEKDEYFYHEMFVHVPMLTYSIVSKTMPNKVLIIGGGDGGILREVLKYKSVNYALMIEIDEAVVKACSKFMPSLNDGSFNNDRADIRFIDGINYIKNAAKNNVKFDVILVDSTDPIGAAESLFTEDFYSNCKQCLNENGILVTQSGVPFFQKDEMLNVNKKLSSVFDESTFFIVPVPTYVGSYMVLSFASNFNPVKISLKEYQEQFKLTQISNLKYYNPEIHFGSFLLPNYIKQSII